MSREAHIPLALWISAAIVAHLAGGSGAVEVAKVYEDRAQFRAFVHGVRDGLRPADTTFEILTAEMVPTPPLQPGEAPDKEAAESDDSTEPDKDAPKTPKTEAEAKKPPKPAEVASATPPAPPPEPEKKPVEAVPVPAKPVVQNAPPPADHRIAVRQHVQPNQEDNPTANRIADEANHSEEESVARIRSHDQDAPDPTPGTHAGPKGDIGDSEESKVAHSEDKPGDEKHAPGEAKETSTSPEHHAPGPDRPAPVVKLGEAAAPKAGGPKGAGAVPVPPAPAAPPPSPGGAGPASPEVAMGNRGGYTLDPANPGGDGKSRAPGRRQSPAPYKSPVDVHSVGLNAAGAPGQVNLNLDLTGVEAAVGDKQLKAERAADGAARRSKHRGSWETNKFERWRAAIENYEPSVKLGNQTSLNAARVPFATYINSIHNRLHPIFAEEFLASLDNLPSSHVLNQDLITHIEIVLSKDEGRIVRMGVTKASGSTAFDIVALNSISRASPYGKAPDAIVSPDGNVYLHWEFHRDPFDACTTRNARPFLLKGPPMLGPAPLVPKKAPGTKPADERLAPRPAPLMPTRQQ